MRRLRANPTIAETRAGVVTKGTVSALADAVRTVLADPAGYGAQARTTARERFGMGAIADQLTASYGVRTRRPHSRWTRAPGSSSPATAAWWAPLCTGISPRAGLRI